MNDENKVEELTHCLRWEFVNCGLTYCCKFCDHNLDCEEKCGDWASRNGCVDQCRKEDLDD